MVSPVASVKWQPAPGDKISGWELGDVQKAAPRLVSHGLQGDTLAWMLCQWQVSLSSS